MDLLGLVLEFDGLKKFEAHFADSSHVRCFWDDQDTGWRNVSTKELKKDVSFKPSVTISLELHVIWSLFK